MAQVAWSLRTTHAGSTDGTAGCNRRPAGRDGEVRFLGDVDSTPAAVERLVRKLEKRYRRLSFVYGRPSATCTASRSG